jgi:chemotaxis protein CheD
MNQAAAFSRQSADQRLVHVIQGDYAVTDETSVVLTTVLGSCVAACLHDPVAQVGGMNHFLLPGDEGSQGDSLRYGINSMELLINGLLRMGARRDRLEAKLFGGARVVQGLSDVGAQNAVFARRFLAEENILCLSESLGGSQARRVQFWPSTGRVRQLLLDKVDPTTLAQETRGRAAAPARDEDGDLELF